MREFVRPGAPKPTHGRESAPGLFESYAEAAERAVAELPARLSVARSLEAQAMMLRTGVDLGRQLLAKREAGVAIPDETIALMFDALDAGLERMIELMPPEESSWR